MNRLRALELRRERPLEHVSRERAAVHEVSEEDDGRVARGGESALEGIEVSVNVADEDGLAVVRQPDDSVARGERTLELPSQSKKVHGASLSQRLRRCQRLAFR